MDVSGAARRETALRLAYPSPTTGRLARDEQPASSCPKPLI